MNDTLLGIMRFSENEVKLLLYVVGLEKSPHRMDLSKALDLSPRTISWVVSRLENKGFLARENDEIVLSSAPPVGAFKKLYYSRRASPYHLLMADRRVDLLAVLDSKPKSVAALVEQTGIKDSTIYLYLENLLRLGAARRSENKRSKGYRYAFNFSLWSQLKGFVDALLEYQAQHLIPRKALLIKSYGGDVLFKSLKKRPDATPTSFSVFKEYGIKLGMRDYYYTLPKRELSIREIFVHSLDSAEDHRQRLFCILFYLKYKDRLEGVEHPMVEEITAVLKDEKIKGYPSIEDIEDQAALYEIKL
jgi:predicted transcriptional regulator